MSTIQEVMTVGETSGVITISEEQRKTLREVLDYQEAGVRVGEKVLSLPSIFLPVILGEASQADFVTASKLNKNEVGRLFHTAVIVYHTKVTTPATALKVANFVYGMSRTGVKFEDIETRFKRKPAQALNALGQPNPMRWVQGDLEVESRLATNELEKAREARRAQRIAEGKGGTTSRKVKTPAQRMASVTDEIVAITEAITTMGVVTEDLKLLVQAFTDASNDLVAVLSAG